MNHQSHNTPGRPALVVAIAIVAVALLGLVSWESITDGKVKDFSLFSDLTDTHAASDPGTPAPIPTVGIEVDSIQPDTSAPDASDSGRDSMPPAPTVQPRPTNAEGLTLIEDYSPGMSGLDNIRQALAEGRHVRIAVVGDSYIEGDIMTQDLRSTLQEAYSGSGVGFMNMHSEFPGFRRSVVQGGSGWKCYTASQRGKDKYMGLSEQYATANGTAKATYKGTGKIPHADSWNRSQLLLVTPEATQIRTRTGGGQWTTHQLEASDRVQTVTVDSSTTSFDVEISNPSVIALGVWLGSTGPGVSVDCMSSRGIPGYSLGKISTTLCRQMSQWIDYDLIVLEFGINVLSAKQRDYSRYGQQMAMVVEHLRECYPGARVLIMGIGDRGERRSGQVHTMATVPAMIAAQREAARTSGALFWDTQAAMGGDDAIVEWSRTGRANKDYVHLSHKGGADLGQTLARALMEMIDL